MDGQSAARYKALRRFRALASVPLYVAERARVHAGFLGEAQHSFGDDVALDFVGAAGDGGGGHGDEDFGNQAALLAVFAGEHGVGAGDQRMHVGGLAGDVARCELAEGAFRALRAALLLCGSGAAGGPFGALGQRQEFRDFLPGGRVGVAARGLRPLDHEIDPSGPLRVPLVRFQRHRGLFALLLVNASGQVPLSLHAAQAVRPAPLVHQRRDGHLPAVADGGDEVLGRHHGVGEEHLIERRMAVHLLERAHFDALLAHVEHEVREALVLRHVPVRACEQEAVVGVVGAGGPHLLAVDDPVVAVAVGAGGCAGEVGAAAGLAEELAPGVFAGEDAAQESCLVGIAAVFEQGGRGQEPNAGLGDADGVQSGEFLVHHRRKRFRHVAPVPPPGPNRHAPTRVRQQVAPGHQVFVRVPVCLQPFPHLAAHAVGRGVRGCRFAQLTPPNIASAARGARPGRRTAPRHSWRA